MNAFRIASLVAGVLGLGLAWLGAWQSTDLLGRIALVVLAWCLLSVPLAIAIGSCMRLAGRYPTGPQKSSLRSLESAGGRAA